MDKEEFLERQYKLPFEDVKIENCGGEKKCDLSKRIPDLKTDPECKECWDKLFGKINGFMGDE